jgi:hypothetical protein
MDLNGNLIIPDVNEITDDQWEQISRRMVALGFAIRGGKDAKELMTKRLLRSGNSQLLKAEAFPEWVEVISNVLNLTNNKSSKKVNYDISKIIRDVIKEFGLTSDIKLAGYVFPNGSMLKLSHTNYMRDLDHREVVDAFRRNNIVLYKNDKEYTDTDYMIEFVRASHAVRIHGNQGGIDIAYKPTSRQLDVIKTIAETSFSKEVYLEIWDRTMGSDSKKYEAPVSSQRVLMDIATFYKTGKLGNKSGVQAFREGV